MNVTSQTALACYTADWLDRYSIATLPNLNGNRSGNQTHLGATTSTTVTANNRLSTDGVHNYTWDDEGNMERKTEIATGNYEIYQWDHRQRLNLIQFRNVSNVVLRSIIFRYDEHNHYVRRVEDPDGAGPLGSNIQLFVNDRNQIVLRFEKIQTNNVGLVNRYLWSDRIDQLLADEKVSALNAAGVPHWSFEDQLNTVRDVATYNSGTGLTSIVKHRSYDAFGNITLDSAPGIKEWFAFQGKWFEISFSATWHINRWFNTVLGKWQGQDPIGFEGGDKNLGRFVNNAPTITTDSSGLAGSRITTEYGYDPSTIEIGIDSEFLARAFRDTINRKLAERRTVREIRNPCDRGFVPVNTRLVSRVVSPPTTTSETFEFHLITYRTRSGVLARDYISLGPPTPPAGAAILSHKVYLVRVGVTKTVTTETFDTLCLRIFVPPPRRFPRLPFTR